MIKATPTAFASFFGPIFVDCEVARWASVVGFSVEVGLLDGSYMDVFFLHPVYDV